MFPIADLHSDLLSYLTEAPDRLIDDPASRNSLPQMRAGQVLLQTLAIFSRTGPHSVAQAKKQFDCFHKLLEQFPPFRKDYQMSSIYLIAAIENASAFALETESLSTVFSRLQEIIDQLTSLFYITLTWDPENRFAGGSGCSTGLKKDGELLLEWLSHKGIAIDLSHTSDKSAADIIEHIDKKDLAIPLMASHSNFRAITPMARNLPDPIAREIIHRKGIIGLNLFAPFIHPTDPSVLLRHVEYGLSLGGAQALCFGADFFCDTDFSFHLQHKYPDRPFFFPEYANSSSYPHIINLLRTHLHLSDDLLEAIAHKNAFSFLNDIF